MENKDRFYSTRKWAQKRQHILKRDAYQDQLEKRAGKTIQADIVHHIFPREQYPQYTWDDWNLISISKKTHQSLHLYNGQLSPLGEKLKREVANKRGIKYFEKILVIGLPGTGKSTWAKANLKNGLCYDLDYIAAAFRLKNPHEEEHKPARHMANAMMKAWAVNAERFTSRIIIIRTAPTIEELEEVDPDKIIHCHTIYKNKTVPGFEKADATERLKQCLLWAKVNGVEIVRI